MDTKYDIRLHFLTDQNNIKSLTIPRANPGVTPQQVAESMLDIIDSDVVHSTIGAPRFKHFAELVRTEQTAFNLG